MATETHTSGNIDISINVIQDVAIEIEGETTVVESDYDYVLDVDLSKTFIVNGNWVTNPVLLQEMLVNNNIGVISHGIKLNNTKNIFVISKDDGTISVSKNGGYTYNKVVLDTNGSRLFRATISNGHYPAYILLCSQTTIYTSLDSGTTWSNINMSDGGLPNNTIGHCHISNNGKIQMVTYSYLNATMNSSNIPSYFYISINYGNTWTKINLSYRQLEVNWIGTSLYYTTYGASPTLYYTNISSINFNNISWIQLKIFTTPTTGYCPIFTLSDTGKYITEYHINSDSTNTVINTSKDFGFTWSSILSPYLINNSLNLDITTMSLSGKIQTYWVYDITGQNYLSYSIDFGVNWAFVQIFNLPPNDYGTYDITDDGSHILLYQTNIGSMIYYRLSITMNDLFTTLTYEQTPQDSTKVDLNVLPNNYTFGVLLSAFTSIYSAKTSVLSHYNPYTSLRKNPASVGDKMLQVIATKLFGNPRTVAAIVNDTDFINLTTAGSPVSISIINGIVNAIYAQATSLFKQYVGSGIYSADGYGLQYGYGDSTVPITFNLTNTTMSMPLTLIGALGVVGSNLGPLASGLALIKNGVDCGGSKIVNGLYSIPFLLKFRYGG